MSSSKTSPVCDRLEYLTVSVPLGEGGQVGEVGDDHYATHQTDGAALHPEAHREPVEQGDLQLTGMDLRQTGHWATSEAWLLKSIWSEKYIFKSHIRSR